MKLVYVTKCEVCGKDVSSDAWSCPHCGHPYRQNNDEMAEQAKSRVVMAVALAIVMAMMMIFR